MTNSRVLPGFDQYKIGKPRAQKKKKNETKYIWMLGSEPPELGSHSIAKHNILRQYLERYVAILTSNKVVERLHLSLVDGFSGGGAYRCSITGNKISGSPVIMLDAMATAEAAANLGKKKKFKLDVDFYFVEENPQTIEYLKQEIRQCTAAQHRADGVNFLPGTFARHLDGIITSIKRRGRTHRAIFLLDQYGYTDVTLANIRKIFHELPHAEVILTFAVDWMIDFISDSQKFESTLNSLELAPKRELLLQIRELNAPDWRPTIQHLLHQHFFERSGADCYTPFFVHSKESHRAYWLLHFSKHSTARNAMVDLHWQMQNHFQHFGKAGFEMLLGYDPDHANSTPYLPFDFGPGAAGQTKECLLIELPRRLSEFGQPMPFGEFFKAVVNETPATKQMLADAAAQLTLDHEIEVTSTTGKKRRNGVVIADSDILRLPRRRLLLPPRCINE